MAQRCGSLDIREVRLIGDPKARYEFTDLYTGKSFAAEAAALILEGIEFDLPENSSRVLKYQRVP